MPPKGTQITPAFFEPSLDEYLTLVGSCVKNAAGIWVPVSATNPMPTTAQDGSIVAIGAKGDAAVTDPTLAASEIALLKGLIKQLQTGPNLVQLSGSSALPTGASTEAKQDALNAIIGEKQTSPTANTLLARLKSLEDKIDAITGGTTPAVTKLSGSNLEVAAVVNVPLAGARQQLPDKACREVTIIAKRGNTGYIYVGKSTVSSTVYGAELGELDSITLAVSNTNEIYIDASVSGEGISYVAI